MTFSFQLCALGIFLSGRLFFSFLLFVFVFPTGVGCGEKGVGWGEKGVGWGEKADNFQWRTQTNCRLVDIYANDINTYRSRWVTIFFFSMHLRFPAMRHIWTILIHIFTCVHVWNSENVGIMNNIKLWNGQLSTFLGNSTGNMNDWVCTSWWRISTTSPPHAIVDIWFSCKICRLHAPTVDGVHGNLHP